MMPERKIVAFDKHRKRNRQRNRPVNIAKVLTITAAAIAVVSTAIWLVRDVSETFRPAEGSLIVNINTATSEELISVPGIGASRAAQIIAGRPYATVDELAKIAGFGGKTLESLRPFVSVEGETRPFE